MREILFRGKDTENGQWIYGYYIGGSNHIDTHEICDINDVLMCMVEVTPQTVGQFTGLTDKNGKKIFEGDIVKEQDVVHNGEIQIHGHIFSVAVRNGCWCAIPIYDTDKWDFLNSHLPFLEVIGNIHDHLELPELTKRRTDNA